MAENLQCSMCGEEATVHLTQIVNTKIIKVDLCEACAQAKGVTDPEGFSLADLMNKNDLTPQQSSQPDLVCTDCGMETSDFRKTGRLGCRLLLGLCHGFAPSAGGHARRSGSQG